MLTKTLARTSQLGLLALLTISQAHAIPEKDTGNLGEIRYSILSVDDFKRIYGEGWVLLNGQPIQDSDLYRERLWAGTNLPNASGQFLRCHNAGRPAHEGNPSGDLAVGTEQMDQFKAHSHSDKGHQHYQSVQTACIENNHISINSHQNGNASASQVGVGGTHILTQIGHAQLNESGGSETRPRCTIVNAFIKINRTPESQHTNLIMDTINGIPAQIAGNEALLNAIRGVVQAEVRRAMAQVPANR